jgi:CheY-like chemotaxis protein
MKIHVLEGNLAVRNVLRLILEERLYLISESATAETALEICSLTNSQPDLLIADIQLPVSSGIDVALQVKAWLPNLKVILTSGAPPGCYDDRHSTLYNEMPSESVRFLQKPFVVSDVFWDD